MRPNATLRQVAERAGVARGTVSNVLNHPERVSPALAARVRDAMEELGFVRNESARQLRSGRSNVLALSLLDTWNPYFNEVARGIEDCIYAEGWTLSVSTSAMDQERERRNLRLFEERRVAGIFAVPTDDAATVQLEAMRKRGVGCILVDRHARGAHVSSVSVDDVAGGRLAGAHLKDIGRKRLAYCGNPSVHSHAADRLAGMREGSSMDVELIDTGFVTIAAGVEAGQTIAARSESDRPDAVFCANDLIAIGVLQALIRARIAVPEEIAIVGYDDIEFASQVSVPLTTIRQPAYGLGRRAAEILLAEIAEGPAAPPTHVIHTPELVTRESTLPR